MNEYPTGGGEAVTTITEGHRRAGQSVVTDAQGHIVAVPPLPHDTEYVTVQSLAPLVIGLIRGLYLGLFGAVGGLLTGLQMGSREPVDLMWGALIGFCLGFLGRGAEALIIDTPKASSTTEKV